MGSAVPPISGKRKLGTSEHVVQRHPGKECQATSDTDSLASTTSEDRMRGGIICEQLSQFYQEQMEE